MADKTGHIVYPKYADTLLLNYVNTDDERERATKAICLTNYSSEDKLIMLQAMGLIDYQEEKANGNH